MVTRALGVKLRGVKQNYEHIYRVYSPALRRNVEFKDDISGNHIGIAANFYS